MEEVNHSNRDHALLSASSAHRWLACPPSAVVAEAYPDQDTDFTREGTLAHEVAEWVVSGRSKNGGPLDKGLDDGVDHEMLECAHRYRDYIREQIKSDRAVVLFETRVDYSPWAPGGFGTADCIILQDGEMDVIDYKYGKGVEVSAVDNPQAKLYGLGALNDYGFAYDVHTIRLHIFQPRMDNTSTDTITLDELMAWGESIKPIAEQAAKGEGEYKAGGHCKFCPHAGVCRTLTATCTDFIAAHGVTVAVPKLAPHEVAEVLTMEPLVAMWLKRVKDQAFVAMMSGEEVPGFKLVEGKLGNRKWADELKVAETLKGAGYQLDDITETKLLSPASMDKSIGKDRVKDLLGGLIDRAPGAPTIAPESDKRKPYDRLAEAKKDFE